jgi:hypothetical protein
MIPKTLKLMILLLYPRAKRDPFGIVYNDNIDGYRLVMISSAVDGSSTVPALQRLKVFQCTLWRLNCRHHGWPQYCNYWWRVSASTETGDRI